MSENIPPPAPAAQTNLSLDTKQQAQQQSQQQLFKLPIGAQFNALVVGGDKNGNAIIKFGGNDLILSSPLALSKGANIALKVDGNSGVITLKLLTIDGKLPPTNAQAAGNQLQNPSQQNPNSQLPTLRVLTITPENVAQNLGGNANNAAAQATQTAQTGAAQQAAVVIGSSATTIARGVVISPSPEALQNVRVSVANSLPPEQSAKLLPNIPAELKAGSQLNFKINNIQQPPAQTQQTASTPQNTGLNQAGTDGKVHTDNKVLSNREVPQQGQPQQTTQNPQTTQQQTPPQSQIAHAVKFVPTVQTASDGSVKINALVTGINSSSQLVVDTPIGKLSITSQIATSKVPIGSILNLQITDFGSLKAEIPAEKITPLQALTNDWTNLRTLAQGLDNAGQQNSLNKLAGLDSVFASRLIAYMSAVKDNNINNWLSSELMNVLDEATREQIIGKLRGDFSNLQRLLNDNPSSSWQTLLFPVFDGEELHQARLHLKYLEDENGEIDKDAGSRFIVELEASYFGELQFDGLVRKQASKSNFDLVIRSHKEIEGEIQNDIRTIFGNVQELTGFNGSIEFATHKEFPHRPMDERLSRELHNDGSIQA